MVDARLIGIDVGTTAVKAALYDAQGRAIKTYAETFGAVFAPSYGAEARANAIPVVILEACSSVARGEAVNDPSTIGIDCEARTEVAQ